VEHILLTRTKGFAMIFSDLVLFAYVGPETFLPLVSALAAAGGAVMMGWRQVRRGFDWCVRLIVRR